MEKYAVIGSNSFSGSHFVDYLLENRAEVIGISRSPEPHPVFLPYRKRDNAGFTFHRLDLNHDLAEIAEVLEKSRPDYVVNFAAQSMVAESWTSPRDWFQTNVVATVSFHEKIRHFDFIKKYVHISTPEVYGACSGRVPENRCYKPSTPYAVSRAAADMSLDTFFKSHGFPVVFTRAANVFGPGQQLYRIVPRAALYFLTGRKLILHGGGTSVRSFIHIRDVAAGTLRAARSGKPGEIYHFSTHETVSIRNLVMKVADIIGVPFKEAVQVGGERLGKDSAYLLDIQKAEKELHWHPAVSLKQGIEETVNWVRVNLDVLKEQPGHYIHKA